MDRPLRLVLYPEPRGPRVLPVGELVLWYGMFAPCGRLLGTTGFARGAPFNAHLMSPKNRAPDGLAPQG